MPFRQSCACCGHDKKTPWWETAERKTLIACCDECGCNFHGDGVYLPLDWANHSQRGLSIRVIGEPVK